MFGVSGILDGDQVSFTHFELASMAIASGLDEFFGALAYKLSQRAK